MILMGIASLHPSYALSAAARAACYRDKQMAISFDQAKVVAERTVRAIADANNDEFGIVGNETTNEGWLFFYNSKDFIETGNFSSSLAGNGPIFVDRSGFVKTLPSAIPWQVAIKSL
jgi:hypothetical protein